MSNIYIQEPPTLGKVLLKTSVGDIDIELWSKECPKACRNFVQLCMEGYYNGTIFHRVVKEFIVQGGDPNGDGTGGESIYSEPFKDEFHSRLRYTRRGLVGMANSDKDDNGSQFFFTMAPTPELQNKNTLFAKVTGDTVFNMLKLEEGLVDQNERPMYPNKIIRAEILNNPFEDIVPRTLSSAVNKKEKKKKREKGVKNFGLLSFGEEAAEDEVESKTFLQALPSKGKSMHDVVDDPKLSKEAITIVRAQTPSDGEQNDTEGNVEERINRIKNKFNSNMSAKSNTKKNKFQQAESDSEEDMLMTQEKEKQAKSEKLKEEIRKEISTLKKQYQMEKKSKDELLDKKIEKELSGIEKEAANNEIAKAFIDEQTKYSSMKTKLPKKGPSRENFTLTLLSKFRSKLDSLKQIRDDNAQERTALDDRAVEQDIHGDDWLGHTLRFEETAPILAKDASTKSDDWYDAYDPRNPLNKRKRGEHTSSNKTDNKRRK